MIDFTQRLAELKEEIKPELERRMIFLCNPRDTRVHEAIVAWTAVPKKDLSGIKVNENATMQELWELSSPDILAFATMLGSTVQQALPRLNQLRELSLVYPDGSVAELALSIVNAYLTVQIGALRQKRNRMNE